MTMNRESTKDRRSIRLTGYDYSLPGAYFITLVVQHRRCLFGDVSGGEILLNGAGCLVRDWLQTLPGRYPGLILGSNVIMPNHLHCILEIPEGDVPEQSTMSLGRIVSWYKAMTTKDYIAGVEQKIYPPFKGRLWQRNYYEHIIRNTKELESIRYYIEANPAAWSDDTENPLFPRRPSRQKQGDA
ncbi:MAG: transposase [Candidatus Brocadiia bacterium]